MEMKNKKLVEILSVLALAGVVCSCMKEVPTPKEDNPGGAKTVVFSVSDDSEVIAAKGTETKAYFQDLSGDDYTQIFSAADAISVFDGNGTNVQFTNIKGSDSKSAQFRGTVTSEPSTYYALYPYQNSASIDGSTITAQMPCNQVSSNGAPYKGTDPGALLSVAYSTSEQMSNDALKFVNCYSILQFDVSESDITSVLVEGNNGEAIAGSFTVSVADNPTIEVTEPKTSIVLTPSQGDVFEQGTYAVAMLPTSFSQGFKIVYKHSGSAKCSIKNYKTSFNFARNTCKDVNGIPFSSPNYKYYYIFDKNELNDWRADNASWASTDVAYLGADIDMNGVSWTAAPSFSGTFDGRGHSIYNLVVSSNAAQCGFFSTVTGTVKDVVFGSSNSASWDGVSVFTTNYSSSSASPECAPICRLDASSARVSGVSNFAKVQLGPSVSTAPPTYYLAGIVANIQSGSVSDCHNAGNLAATYSTKVIYLGGICANQSTTTGEILGCSNSGSLTSTAATGGDLEISGIVADAAGKIKNCSNSGDINVSGNVGAALYIGGVCGWLATNESNPMSICTNTGNITCDGISINNQIYGGGVLGGEKNSITVTHNGFINRGKVSFGENVGITRNSNDNECFIGGCVGGNGSTKATYANFENYGDVIYKGYHRVRIGGVASYASKNPNGAICKANVTYLGKSTSKQSYAGGVVGYLNITSISGLTFEGVLNTSGSDKLAYTGGITGYINQACTMSGCKVSGQVKGVTLSDTGKDVGLLCCTTTSRAINFEGCSVAPGTKRGDTVALTLVRSHSDCGGDWTKGALCGGAGSTGTLSGCFVGTVTYADPLTFLNGTPVTQATWNDRRAEIRNIFEENMYGRIPAKTQIYTEKFDSGNTTVTGNTAPGSYSAVREQYHMWFKSDHSGPRIDWLVVRPASSSAVNPAKVIFGLIFMGNHSILPDTQISIPTCWYDDWSDFYISGNKATAAGRGCTLNSGKRYHYPIDYFLSRGYAFVCATYGEVCCDPELDPGDRPQSDCFETGVFDLWKPRSNSDPTRPMALGAWAWAMMEGMDLVESIPELDDSKVVLTGVSRLGKSCLIAGAFDDRFAVVAPVQTGGGGVPLTKYYLPGKETIASETSKYTHWFIPKYATFAGHESEMTFDQHLLVSCVAPRAIFSLGFDMPHFNSPGEFQCLREASPAWTLWGKEPLPNVVYPDAYGNEAIGANMAYYRRTEASGHGVKMDDWTRLLDFADGNF